jgi:hypothetical protein
VPDPPKSYKQAICYPEYGEYWYVAMYDEITSQKSRGVWVNQKLPVGRKPLPGQWVLDYKEDKDGYINKFKARLVAGGHKQVEGLDYKDTFAPVVRVQAIRIMIALSLIFGMRIEQMDISTAFLYGKLDEPNFMKMPPGFEEVGPNGEILVWRLIHSIYGLHQAARQWFKRIRDYLISEGFKQCTSNSWVMKKIDPDTGELNIVMIYVDDILLLCNSKKTIYNLKQMFKREFEVKEIGEAE